MHFRKALAELVQLSHIRGSQVATMGPVNTHCRLSKKGVS